MLDYLHRSEVGGWLPLAPMTTRRAIQYLAGTKRPNRETRPGCRQVPSEAGTRQLELIARQLDLERGWPLRSKTPTVWPRKASPLHSTRPVRDPLVVLESEFGGVVVEDAG